MNFTFLSLLSTFFGGGVGKCVLKITTGNGVVIFLEGSYVLNTFRTVCRILQKLDIMAHTCSPNMGGRGRRMVSLSCREGGGKLAQNTQMEHFPEFTCEGTPSFGLSDSYRVS